MDKYGWNNDQLVQAMRYHRKLEKDVFQNAMRHDNPFLNDCVRECMNKIDHNIILALESIGSESELKSIIREMRHYLVP